MSITIIVCILFSLGLIALVVASQRISEKRRRFAGRKLLSLHEVFSTYFSSSNLREEEVIELWTKAAELLKLDPRALRPKDRFKVELAPVSGYSSAQDELEDLEAYFDRRCKEIGKNPKSQKVETLDDFVRILSSPST